MTRKHFEAIAAIIDAQRDIGVEIQGTANELAAFFATENPNFDRERFLKACGF